MAYLELEGFLSKTNGSVYKLVVLASRRALEIAGGQPKLVVADNSLKPSAVALAEIAGGRITFKKV